MEYHAPYGSSDPDASYVDRNSGAALRGSVPPAAAIEEPQREIVDLIEKAGLAPEGGEWQLAKAVQSGRVIYAVAGGTANALTATLSPAPDAYADGLKVMIIPVAASTGDMSLNLNGLGVVPIHYPDGTRVSGGEAAANQPMLLLYRSAKFWLLNPVFYFTRLTPLAQQKASNFIVGTVAADLPNPPDRLTVVALSITGARYIDANASFLIRNQSITTNVNVTGTLRLYNVTDAVYLDDGFGGGAILGPLGVASTLTSYGQWSGLDPLKTYQLQMSAQKGDAVGPTDPSRALISAVYG